MIKHHIFWKRLDKPGHEAAILIKGNSDWFLKGSSLFLYENNPCSLTYSIRCSLSWETKLVKVNGWVGEKIINIEIKINPGKNWYLNDQKIPDVKGCIDIDLNFSPSTNMLPLQRLCLSSGQSGEVKAAWLKFPSFELKPLNQLYKRINESAYYYESGGGSFSTELKIDKNNFVIEYPGFFKAINK